MNTLEPIKAEALRSAIEGRRCAFSIELTKTGLELRVGLTKPKGPQPELKLAGLRSGTWLSPEVCAVCEGDGSVIDGADKSGSAIDQALVNILAFFTKDPDQIERLWLSCPQGQREKTQRRKDYRDRTIRKAFDNDVPMADISGLLPKPTTAGPSIFQPAEPTFVLPMVDAMDWEGQPAPPLDMLFDEIMLAGEPALFSGHGGIGKSQMALQSCFAVATGTDFFGHSCRRPGSSMFVTAEDPFGECHRRRERIVQARGLDRASFVGRVIVSSLVGVELPTGPLLAVAEKGLVKPTVLYGALKARIEQVAPSLVVLDNAALMFGGNENDRSEVQQFVTLIRRLAGKSGATIVLIAHPSKQAMKEGSGYSGSTAWHNAFRGRFTVTVDPDNGARILRVDKISYGPEVQGDIRLRFEDGIWVRENNGVDLSGILSDAASKLILELLPKLKAEGRNVGPNTGRNYLPAVLADDPRANRTPKKVFVAAMQRLFDAGLIRTVEYGPPSNRHVRIEVTAS